MHLMGGMNERRPTEKLIEESGPCLWNCDLGCLKSSAYCDFMDNRGGKASYKKIM